MQIRTWMIAALMFGFASAASLAAHAQEERRSGASLDAVPVLIGNTLVYAKPDQPGDEAGVFLRLDGTGRAAARGPEGRSEPRPVRWTMFSDGKFCVTDIGRQSWDGDCGVLSIDGDKAMLAPANGPGWPGKILEGDAWKLDPAARSEERFIGRAAIERLVGNTLIVIPYGGGREYRAQYFMADGMVRRAHNDQPDFDHWALQPDERWSIRGKDDQLCFSGGAWKTDFCARISIAGDLVTLRDEKAGPLLARLVNGDARNLSPAAEAVTKKMTKALINKTVLLKAADRQGKTDSVIYFLRDGAGRAKWGGGAPKPIRWLIQPGGNLCVAERRRALRDEDCAALSIDGDAMTLTEPGRPAIPGRILKGNALKM